MGIENPIHILFLAAVALVVLGPKRLPELARAAGKSMREFREALNGGVVEEEPIGGQVLPQAPPPPAQLAEPEQEPE
jgi:sec-independent protein translocase protein TatA